MYNLSTNNNLKSKEMIQTNINHYYRRENKYSITIFNHKRYFYFDFDLVTLAGSWLIAPRWISSRAPDLVNASYLVKQ